MTLVNHWQLYWAKMHRVFHRPPSAVEGDMDQRLEVWGKRDLSKKRYVYFWADGIYCNVRMADRQCLLVIIGVTEYGHKELVALEGGIRESEQTWWEVLGI